MTKKNERFRYQSTKVNR